MTGWIELGVFTLRFFFAWKRMMRVGSAAVEWGIEDERTGFVRQYRGIERKNSGYILIRVMCMPSKANCRV